jgi:transcriptional regulator with XRE-family HTH domain
MSDEARKQLAERLREAREYLGLSQEEVAQHLGLPRPAVSQIEHGNRRVDAIELATFAKLYQRPVSHFTGEETINEPPQIELLKRAATELSDQDRSEVLRFAEFLRSKARAGKAK